MPVAAVAREPRRLDCKDSTNAAFADRRQQALETRTVDAPSRAPEIFVDDFDCGPTKLPGTSGKAVLPALAFLVVHELIGRRLTDVDLSAAREMLSHYLGHRLPPRLRAPRRFRSVEPPQVSPTEPCV